MSETHTAQRPATPPPTVASASSEPSNHDKRKESDSQKATYHAAHGQFAGEVAAAIDKRAGLATPATSSLVPFVDAPLFGELDLESPETDSGFETGLPPRAHADELVSIYWQYIDPTEPFLDREQFSHEYDALYSVDASGRHLVWLNVLYAVLALAVQRKESTPFPRRQEEGSRYFRRAWALLRPETVIWKAPSLEGVQCLMLLNRYLHCTNNQHATWMTAGLATRLAQTMCCYHYVGGECRSDEEIKRRVWASCLSMHR